MVMMFIPSDKRETLVCIRKTATRHKRGEGNRSDRNLKATSKGRKNREIEKTQKREEKVASFGGAVRDSVPEDELSGGRARHSENGDEMRHLSYSQLSVVNIVTAEAVQSRSGSSSSSVKRRELPG